MKRFCSLLLLTLMILTAGRTHAQSAADSLLLASPFGQIAAPGLGITIESLQADSLCGAPQCITVCRVPRPAAPLLRIGVSDSLTRSSEIAAAADALVAVNGSYFDMRRGNSVCFLKIGPTVIDSTRQRMAVNGALRCALADSVPVEIRRWDKDDEVAYTDSVSQILASGPVLLLGGVYEPLDCVTEEFGWRRHPRTAIGIDSDGSLLLVTADGRHEGKAAGLTLPQLAWVMKQLGAVDALNLDGGGSTTMWTVADGVVNHPSDNRRFDHEGERRVPNIVYVAK